jgi:hypothetical protein
MTTNPEPTEPRPDEPDSGEVEYIEDRDQNPPNELAQPQFDDQGDGDEVKPQQE